jgi:small GTP-binding protein
MKKIVIIGHVDAGKSTLVGHLLVNLGIISSHVAEQIKEKAIREKKESQIYSRMTDIYEEEMEKGKTHEFNEIQFTYGDNEYLLIDTPGHQSFVRSMISGISRGVNSAIVVVSMKENEFQASFTEGMLKEHLTLAKAIGIENLIIVGNKMELIKWNKDKAKEQIGQVANFAVKQLFWDKTKVKVVALDAYSGSGITNITDCADWIKNSLLDHLIQFPEYNSIAEKTIIDTDELKIQATIFPAEGQLLTKMYMCMLHYDGKEAEVIVSSIKGKTFIKSASNIEIIFDLQEKINIPIGCRVILRKNDLTIGCGIFTL